MLKKVLWWLLPALVLFGLVYWRFGTKAKTEGALQQQSSERRGQSPPVETGVAGPRLIVTSTDFVGTVESPNRVQLSPKATGRLEFLQVREGDVVQAGQVLARIDPTELQAAVSQQEANVAEARSRLAQAQLQQGPTEVQVSSQLDQQEAALTSASADLNQVTRNLEAQIAAANSAVVDGEARVQSAQVQVANAGVGLQQQEANLRNSQTKLARIEGLYRQGFIAAQEVDDARTATEVQTKAVEVARGQVKAAESALASAQAQLNALRQQAGIVARKGQADIEASRARRTQAQSGLRVAGANRAQSPAFRQNLAALASSVRAAEAQLAQARARLADTSLRSPIDGVVTARNADVGSLASPGQPLLVVQSIDPVFILASVPVQEGAAMRKGQPAVVRFPALGGRNYRGSIASINPAADLASRQFEVRVLLANGDGALKPGMDGTVSFETARTQAPVAVPREAVRRSREGATVAVVGAEDKAEIRQVKLGVSDDRFIQVLEGVAAGDRVVTLSFQPVREGQTVRKPGAPGEGKAEGGRPGRGAARP